MLETACATPDLEARQAAERTVNAGHRAADIIRTIRALARKSTPEMTPFDINSADDLTLTRGEPQRHDILLETELSDDLRPVMGARGQTQQIVLNLVVNGIEAMTATTHRPRVLGVSSRMAGPGDVSIAVADTGTGLYASKVDHIFDAFFTTKPGTYGNGPVDLPLDRQSAWRPPVGVAKFSGGSVFQFTVPAAANRPCEAGS